MLRKVADAAEVAAILAYIGDNFMTTPYLYLNVTKYGLGTERVTTWIDYGADGQMEGVYMLYYDCIHFYTNDVDAYPVGRLLGFIRNTPNKVIMLQGGIGDRIEGALADAYHAERNHIMNMNRVGLENRAYLSKMAGRDDIAEIVELLLADPEYIDIYDRKTLSDQLYDRFDGGFSRYFAVKMDNKVVATCSTYGEVAGFAIVGGVIVHPDYRRRGLAADVDSYACHVLSKENKSRVSFVNYENTASFALHEKEGGFAIGNMAKFVKK